MTGWGIVVLTGAAVFVLMVAWSARRPPRPDPPHDGRWHE